MNNQQLQDLAANLNNGPVFPIENQNQQQVETLDDKFFNAFGRAITTEEITMCYFCRFIVRLTMHLLQGHPRLIDAGKQVKEYIRRQWVLWVAHHKSRKRFISSLVSFIHRLCPEARAIDVTESFKKWYNMESEGRLKTNQVCSLFI